MKWLFIGLGGLVLFQVVRNNSSTASSGGRGYVSGSGGGATGVINSLANLTNAVGHLFHGESSKVSDRDGLINPDF